MKWRECTFLLVPFTFSASRVYSSSLSASEAVTSGSEGVDDNGAGSATGPGTAGGSSGFTSSKASRPSHSSAKSKKNRQNCVFHNKYLAAKRKGEIEVKSTTTLCSFITIFAKS
jgi:hypothetical protein